MGRLNDIINNKQALLLFAAIVIIFYFLPLLMYGKNASIIAYDLLDSSHVWYKMLAQSGMLFSDSFATLPNMMGGLPRLSYGSEYNFILWLYIWFDDFTAYIINNILIHLIAFIGMMLLLDRYVVERATPFRNLITVAVSLLFALTPFWSPGGLSVAGQPLAVWALLNIKNGRAARAEWAVLLFLPFYSSFVLAMMFFIGAAGVYFLYDWIKTRRFKTAFFLALAMMTLLYFLRDYRLVENMLLHSGFVSHREMFHIHDKDLLGCFMTTRINFLTGHPNNSPLNYYYVLPAVLLAGLLGFKKQFSGSYVLILLSAFAAVYALNSWQTLLTWKYFLPLWLMLAGFAYLKRRENRLFYGLIVLLIVIELVYGLMFHTIFETMGEYIKLFKSFNFSRINFLSTEIWYILLALAFQIFVTRIRWGTVLIGAVVFVQIGMGMDFAEFQSPQKARVSFKEYYSTEQFDAIADYIGKPRSSYRVATIGIVPAVTLYNGFHTIDGYSVNYPLAYKKAFRKIIAQELEKSPTNKYLFDQWGSKAYVLVHNVPLQAWPRARFEMFSLPHRFDLNTTAMRELGASYVFSRVRIANADALELNLLHVFDAPDALYRIYVYEIEIN